MTPQLQLHTPSPREQRCYREGLASLFHPIILVGSQIIFHEPTAYWPATSEACQERQQADLGEPGEKRVIS